MVSEVDAGELPVAGDSDPSLVVVVMCNKAIPQDGMEDALEEFLRVRVHAY